MGVYTGGMTSEGTPKWTMRLERELRAKAIEKARLEGRTLADVVREFLVEWVKH